MKFFYVFSIITFFISFLLYKKSNRVLSLVGSIIFFIGFLFCYNVVVVHLLGMLSINGSLLLYGGIQIFISLMLFFATWKRKCVQQYYLDKKELVVALCVLICSFLVAYGRSDGFSEIRYVSGDSSIHYRHTIHFSRELSSLTKENSKDVMHGSFGRAMSISYVNGGFFLKLFEHFSSYKVFLVYDGLCYVLCALVFFALTRILFRKSKNSYLYSFIVTLIYILAFPLNSFLFGFCYLGLAVMVTNLLVSSVLTWKDEFDERVFEKIVLIFILTFSLFFSYYLFVPCIYLALGLYYIYLYKNNNISFKNMFLYGGVTLIIPFLVGFEYFLLPSFFDSYEENIFTYVNLWGLSYDNITPIYLFIIFSFYFIYDWIKKHREMDYFRFTLTCISGYIFIFFVLYILHFSKLYYFYKLFYLYWGFVVLFLGGLFLRNKRVIYLFLTVIMLGIILVLSFPNSKFSDILSKVDIYHWNAKYYSSGRPIFTKGELEIVNESMNYQDVCEQNNEFLITGDSQKKLWFYSITDSIPVINHEDGNSSQLYEENPTFHYWENFTNHDCLIYYYEDSKIENFENTYEVLFENDEGAIIKRRKK